MTFFKTLLLVALTVPVLTACDSDDVTDETITDLVVAEADLSTLELAVIEAGLDGALAGSGTFTVFAPTDAAFQSLLATLGATPEELLARDDLDDILNLHVVPGEIRSGDLEDGAEVTTRNGETLTVVSVGSGFGLDTEDDDDLPNAIIRTADILASNGVVHKIDGVLLPAGN
ncbi:fasciclin domain-containing protein [Rubrivirga sp.]|uniref:fasciclin domain-containing protein n=1 Tax=Rubrivirga sp. TaxID=1885344 RepID=UPI003C77CD28